jgi:hypothetical protein
MNLMNRQEDQFAGDIEAETLFIKNSTVNIFASIKFF